MSKAFFILFISVCFLLAGCKATSTLTVSLRDNASGTVVMSIVLDEEAASIVKSESYKSVSITEIFSVTELKKAGFDVETKENKDGSVSVALRARYANEAELNRALSLFAPAEVLNAKIEQSKSLAKEKQSTSITIDVTRLKELYVDNSEIDVALEQAGIDKEEFTTLINDAFSATTLKVIVKSHDKTQEKTFTAESKKANVFLSASTFRSRFIFNLLGALVSVTCGALVMWRIRRTPALSSSLSPSKES